MSKWRSGVGMRAAWWLPLLFGATLMAQTTGLPGVVDATNAANISSGVLPAGRVASSSLQSGGQSWNGRVVYDKTFWTGTGDFQNNGQAVTVSNGSLLFNPATLSSWTAQQLVLPFVTPDESADYEVNLVVGAIAGNGFAISRNSVNPTNAPGVAAIVVPGTNTLFLSSLLGTALTTQQTVGLDKAIAVGDVIHLVLSQRGNWYGVLYENLTQQERKALGTTTHLGETGNAPYAVTNTAQWAMEGLGGAFAVQRVAVTSRQPANPDVCVVGDSKSAFYDAMGVTQRWANNLSGVGPVAVYAGGADRTMEVLPSVPYVIAAGCKRVVLNIGRNDVCGGVAAATWQGNYQAIVSQLTAAGLGVVHLLPIPETSCDQTALKSWIQTTYAGGPMIDVSPGWQSSYLFADGIHPNNYGHGYIAQQVMASGLLPAKAGSFTYAAPMPAAIYGETPFGEQALKANGAGQVPHAFTWTQPQTVDMGAAAASGLTVQSSNPFNTNFVLKNSASGGAAWTLFSMGAAQGTATSGRFAWGNGTVFPFALDGATNATLVGNGGAHCWTNTANAFNGTVTGCLSQPSAGVLQADTTAKGNGLGVFKASGFVGVLSTPASSTAACTVGQFWDDANYHYVCVAANTIKRVALTAF